MPLDFYGERVDTSVGCMPNQYYREMEQAHIDHNWDNTSAKVEVNEEVSLGSFQFSPVEVWMDYVVGMTSTGLKNGDDFRKLLFRDIDHPIVRGRYYQFEDNYWIGDFTDEKSGLAKSMSVRRCNNYLRIIDPENGKINVMPCVVDYDMTSPSVNITQSIITPNNHAIVMVQGNATTYRLYKTNKRFILGGRPFKLNAFQNAIEPTMSDKIPTLLYLDLYLDEIHSQDDIVGGIAYNGEYIYNITIPQGNMELAQGATGQLTAKVVLNGVQTEAPVVWESSNPDVIQITPNGSYEAVGEVGTSSVISATLSGNEVVKASVQLSVVSAPSLVPTVVLNPTFTQIREHETLEFDIQVNYNGEVFMPDTLSVSLSQTAENNQSAYLSVEVTGNHVSLYCKKRASVKQKLYITATVASKGISAEAEVPIKLVSMLG